MVLANRREQPPWPNGMCQWPLSWSSHYRMHQPLSKEWSKRSLMTTIQRFINHESPGTPFNYSLESTDVFAHHMDMLTSELNKVIPISSRNSISTETITQIYECLEKRHGLCTHAKSTQRICATSVPWKPTVAREEISWCHWTWSIRNNICN